MVVSLLIIVVAGYLLGALPFGYLVARSKGVNIFEVGSKNPGATNVRRVLGHGAGNLVLFPLGMGIALAVFAVTLALTRYVSLASMMGASSLPFAAFAFKQPSFLISISAVVAAFVIYRHRANLGRIRAGTESKVGRKSATAPNPNS